MRRVTTFLLVGQLALCGSVGAVPQATTLSGGTQVPVPVPAGIANKTLIFVNGTYYQPFSKDLAVGTPVYMDAESSQLRATQRSLGYREVDYKKQFFTALTFSPVTPSFDANSNSIYIYGDLDTSSTLAGYWTKKNLPIIAGVDGNGYITDGHHTTAGYLATPGAQLISGKSHIVLGTTVANPSSEATVNAAMWNTFSQTNNAYLYGGTGNQLLLQGDPGYEGLQSIVPNGLGTAMPIIPGTISMGNDLYRSLAWAAVDPIVKTATSLSGGKLAAFKKEDSTSALAKKPDVNFVEFYWADFLRNRVVWNDSAAVTSPNLINAPVSFFAAAANAIALSKSELYVDQNGRSLLDYTGEIYSTNTTTWAKASLKNGLAVAGDTYNVFLTDDSSIQGDIIPSGTEGVVNKLFINTGSFMAVPGAVRNFSSIVINAGATITIDWKDSAVNSLLQNGVAQNKTLAIGAGTGDVTFSGDNNYSSLSTLVVAAGTLTLDTKGASGDSVIWGDISGAGALRKKGTESLTLSGANTFTGGVELVEGYLTLGSTSILDGSTLRSSPLGLGALSMNEGSGLVFEESTLLLNGIKVVSGTGDASGVGVTLSVGENSVELAGSVVSEAPLSIFGPATGVMKLSAANVITGTLTLDTLTLRVGHPDSLPTGNILMQSGATIQAGTSFSTSASLVVDGNLDAGESLLEWAGVISGPGKLTILGSSGGAVRLSGLNTYSGGTEVNQSRVEVGVNGSDAETEGGDLSGRAFGSGDVALNSSVLGFSVPAVIPNAITINGASGVDVGANLGQLSGNITGDGSLFVTGGKDGALFLTGNNSYTGQTEVEGTTLRIYSSAGSAVFGNNTLPVSLNDATLQIVPDFSNPASVSTFGTRGISLGALGGVLDANDNDVLWEGVISGQGKLTVNAARGNVVELTATNTYAGGTEITGGASLKFSRDSNLGSSAGGILLNDGGLIYSGSQALSVTRAIEVRGNSLLDAGSQTLSLLGTVEGTGVLAVGGVSTTGGVIVGESFKTFAGTTLVAGGSLRVTHVDALKGSILEVVSGGGVVQFTTTSANLGGLSGDGALSLPSGFQITIGETGKSSPFSGSIGGNGAFLLSGSARLTMAAGGQIQSAELKLGSTAADKPTLDVSAISGGLVLTSAQTLSGGGTLVGSLKMGGQLKPGNSPGVFTIAKSTLIGADGTFGGNLLLDSTSYTEIEYGKRVDNSQYNWDQVVVGGALTFSTGARVALTPYVGVDSLGVQYINTPLPSVLTLTGVFTSTSLGLGAVLPELSVAPYILNARWVNKGTSLDIVIEKASYGSKVSPQYLQNLGNYLSSTSSSANSGLINYLLKLDSSVNQAQLEAGLQALSSPVYSESQRISLRRTSAVSGALQDRLSAGGGSAPDGWSAFSESYGWSFHREGSAGFTSWNANTFGEIAGVERRLQGLTLGVFGATGYSTASFTEPGSTLKGDSFHGGAFARINSGSLFMDASFLAGSTDQKATRQVFLGGLGGAMSSKFNTSEYASHIRIGCVLPNIAGAYQLTPSLGLVCNGYSQGGASETGTDSGAAGLSTEKKSASAWQTRFGSDISRAFKVANVNGVLSSSLHWIHDFDKGARATPTRFQGAGSGVGAFNALGSTIGADAFEVGVSASLDVTSRTTVRAGANWQLRDGSSQPGASIGVGFRF